MLPYYFWYEGADLPEGIGFGHFTAQHFGALAACALGILVLCLTFRRCSPRGQRRYLRILACAMLAGNLARDVFLLSIGRMSLAYLPLHLCSFSIFVYLLHAFLPEHDLPSEWSEPLPARDPLTVSDAAAACRRSSQVRIIQSRFREALGEIGFVLLMPGTFCALLFPDWTAYPLLNFMCLHSFVWHAVLAAYPILLLVTGRIHPSIRHFWYPAAFLAVITPPIALFDWRFNYNYLFIHWPLSGTPLAWCYDRLGAYWRAGYAALVILVILAEYLVIEAVKQLRRRCAARKTVR